MRGDMDAHALVYTGPGQAQIQSVVLPAMTDDMVEIRTEHSALSRGTERLVFHGRVPESEWARMAAPHQIGQFPFPVRYGYASVGRVTDGPEDLVNTHVFCLFPHQTRYRVPLDAVVPVPSTIPPARAVLAANMETALNALWDAEIRPGTRCLVVGAGLLGALVTCLLSRKSGLSVDVTDIRPDPVVTWSDFGVKFVTPDQVRPSAYDLAFHTSASDAGLQTALDALDFEGRVVELSWYGDRAVNVSLGGNFHANRLQIIGSQVGQIARPRRHALTYSDRLGLALEALDQSWLDRLITEDIPFQDLPDRLADLLADGAPGIATRVNYGVNG